MDFTEILGDLLRNKAGGSGAGADILKDIFGGGGSSRPKPQSSPGPTAGGSRPRDIQVQAKELEDLLIEANRSRPASTAEQPKFETPRAPRSQSVPPREPAVVPSQPRFEVERNDLPQQNERALVLVQAMLNAAKSDGQVTREEQQKILKRTIDGSPQTIQFLNDELDKPLDVRGFAWSVPLGMEHDVYKISLIAVDLDSDREASYLGELAHGLRIPPETRDQIHQQLGAPKIK